VAPAGVEERRPSFSSAPIFFPLRSKAASIHSVFQWKLRLFQRLTPQQTGRKNIFSHIRKAEAAFPEGTLRCSPGGGFCKTAIPIPE
jgi:hypothetical protein